ncbi:MerR family transcriptional regulator [Streptosporangium sandarakinum]|uniref:MerR family transcriptional regulator n=1 Tax=Streptosporangium sandarakinum TaxID=1260955 RepID=UPI00378E42F5
MTPSLLCGAEVTSTVMLNLRCKLWRELLRLTRANFQMRWRLIVLAGEHGLSVRAVRDHEKAGTLPPAECSPHGYRAYAPRHIAALRMFLTRSRLTWPPTRILVVRPPRPAWPSTKTRLAVHLERRVRRPGEADGRLHVPSLTRRPGTRRRTQMQHDDRHAVAGHHTGLRAIDGSGLRASAPAHRVSVPSAALACADPRLQAHETAMLRRLCNRGHPIFHLRRTT